MMNPSHLLLRYGELFLKLGNRSWFERKLMENIRKITHYQVQRVQGRLIIPYSGNPQSLQRVFGLVSYSPTLKVEKNLALIQKTALEFLYQKQGTFKIETNRADKRFPYTSPEVNKLLGQFIEKNTSLKFSFKNPHTILYLEINQDGAHLYDEIMPCCGGLPTGVEGKLLVLLEDEASILAGLLMMKRGCSIYPVSFMEHGDISLLQLFSPSTLSLTVLQNLSELERFARKKGISVLVSGQQFENLSDYETSLQVLRPLIAYGREEIERELLKFRAVI